MMECGEKKGFFNEHGAFVYARCFMLKCPKAKIRRCSRMGKFCPPATASPKLPPGNKYTIHDIFLHRWRQSGGGSYCNIGRSAHLPLGALGLAVGLRDETGGNTA
jgi:hypothetical protein